MYDVPMAHQTYLERRSFSEAVLKLMPNKSMPENSLKTCQEVGHPVMLCLTLPCIGEKVFSYKGFVSGQPLTGSRPGGSPRGGRRTKKPLRITAKGSKRS